MKKVCLNQVKLIIGLYIMATSIFSCKKLIEIPANPPSAIEQTQLFADSANAMAAVAGVYTYSTSSGGFGYSSSFFTKGTACSADELSVTNNDTDLKEFYGYGITPLNSTLASIWSAPYQGIYAVNAVLSGIANSQGLSASFKKQVTGEMKVVRALYYFNLVNLFGAVPLVTSTDFRQTAHIPRTSIDSVYKQIIADLTDARRNISASYASDGRFRPNLYTALTLLAKVHLYRGQWQDAYNEADSVIRSGAYGLEPDLKDVFLDGSSEAIWQLPAIGINAVTAEAADFVPYSGGNTPNYLLTSFLLDAFESGDQRLQNWVGTTVVNINGTDQNFYYPYKYKNKLPTDSPTEDYMIFRLGEVYLIRAEAAARLSKFNEALADLNQIRERAGLEDSDAQGQTNILNAIMHERQVELFTEWGNRWFDLKRTGTAGPILRAEKTGWKDNAALYPIPQGQLQLDNLLKQNLGY